MQTKDAFLSCLVSLNAEIENHQLVIDIFTAHFERAWLNAVPPESERFVQSARLLLGCGNYQQNLLQTVNHPRTTDHFAQNGFGYSFAPRLAPHIHSPDRALMAKLRVLLTIKAGHAGEFAIFECAVDEIF